MDDLYAGIKTGMKAMWSLGDYTEVAVRLEPAAVALADACGISAGDRVLDVAAGNGNFAMVAAGRGASVVAVDFASSMVDLGRARSEAANLGVDWREGDAEDLAFVDGGFDVVASVFGAMFAPRPELVAAEMFRVAAPGGRVAMAAYTNQGFLSAYADLIREFAGASPLRMPSPFEWGDREQVQQRFGPYAASVEFETENVAFEFESVAAGRAFWERTNAPTLALRARVSPPDYAAFVRRAEELMQNLNQATGVGLVLRSDYLLTTARKP